jgi:hypothetical protein
MHTIMYIGETCAYLVIRAELGRFSCTASFRHASTHITLLRYPAARSLAIFRFKPIY